MIGLGDDCAIEMGGKRRGDGDTREDDRFHELCQREECVLNAGRFVGGLVVDVDEPDARHLQHQLI